MSTEAPAKSPRIALVRRLIRDGSARKLREGANLTRPDIARDLGVDPTTVLRWEAGETLPRGDVALRYGELLANLILDPPDDRRPE